MRILIVEDDPVQRRILVAGLNQARHQIEAFADGQAAWERIQASPVSLVITDWSMPRMDGTELIRLIRAAEFPRLVYTILLTVRDGKDDVVRGLEAGADDYLTKPFDPRELAARVAIGERLITLEDRLLTSQRRLEMMASRDALTGLLNRHAILEHAETELDRSWRTDQPLSLALLDIDLFKAINDAYGHQQGDIALRAVANALVDNKRRYDGAGRWGGEEFLLVLPGLGLTDAGRVVDRIRAAIAARAITTESGVVLHVRISAGVAAAPLGALPDLDALLSRADQALYSAKRAGRNRVCLAEGPPREVRESA